MENFDVFKYVILPLLIFMSRILDVSIGTLRIMLISRGNKLIAPVLGFAEVLIWLLAITQVMKNLNNVVSYIAYGSGFAFGNYVGIWLESKLALGMQSVQIITRSQLQALPMILRDEGFAVTTVKAKGARGPVDIIYTVVSRKHVKEVMKLVNVIAPKAFITIEDVRTSHLGYMKTKSPHRLIKKK